MREMEGRMNGLQLVGVFFSFSFSFVGLFFSTFIWYFLYSAGRLFSFKSS